MPLIDLPLDQLHHYQGRNPRPADFDPFWDRAIAELDAVDANVELVPHPLPVDFAEAFELWFTGVGGARIFAKLLLPKRRPAPTPAVLQFHGYSAHSGDWSDKLGYVAAGFTVAAMDCRGQGGRSEDPGGVQGTTLRGHIVRGLDDSPEKLLYRQIFLDTAQIARVVMAMPAVDAQRVGAMGGSQGGALTLACAALEPRIRRAAPTYPFLCDYQRIWEMDLANQAYEELRSFFRWHDPRHQREEEIFTRLGYIDIQHLAPRIHAEVLFAVGLMDSLCPPSSQFATYNKIRSKKELVIYPDFGHEGLPGWNDLTFEFICGLLGDGSP